MTAHSKFARLAVLRPNFGNLAIFQVGWPYNFWIGRFHGRLVENILRWPFLKIILYFKTKSQIQGLFFKITCVSAALCRESELVRVYAIVLAAWCRP